VSTIDKGQDPLLQIAQMKEYCERNKIEVVAEFSEFASGSNDDRKELQKLLMEGKAKRFDVLLVTAFDRLGRSSISFMKLVSTLDKSGIKLISLRENFNTYDTVGRFMLQILISVAELEKKLISSRISQSLYNKKLIAQQTNNGWTCGRPRVVTSDIEAKVLELRSQGKSLRVIADTLNVSKTSVLRVVKGMVQKVEK
jgi:DNA invertase Pin-like site-specific DNA recombinase